MSADSWVLVLEKLSALAFRYGPAFFALLFLLFLVRTASQEYQKVVCRTPPAPPPSAIEQNLYAGLLISSWMAGIILVAVSVWFFFFTYQTKHSFEAMIVGLHPTAQILVEEGYTRRVFRSLEGQTGIQDYHVAILRNVPFKKGDKFRFNYIPKQSESGLHTAPPAFETIECEYVEGDGLIPHFRINDEQGKFQLVRLQ